MMLFIKRLVGKWVSAYSHYSEHDGPLLAAAIAYYLAFSLFPLMLVLVAILGWAFRFTAPGQEAEQRVMEAVSEQVSPALAQQLSAALGSVERSAATTGAFGAILLLVTALAIFTQIDYAFDRIWDDSASASTGWRDRIKQLVLTRLKAVLMLLGVGAFVLAVVIVSLVLQGVQTNLNGWFQLSLMAQRVLEPFIHIGLNVAAFTVVYRFLPKRSARWSSAILGAIVASILWEVGRQVLAAYVVGDKLPTAYGLIGSFMAVMLWTYYAMIVVLYGAAFARISDQESPGLDHPS
jgi:membrane protein